MKILDLRRTAAELTAAAVYEIYPNIELLGGGETSLGFYYDFYFPHPIHPDTISLIEERMRQIVREKRAIRTLEMVPFSASELLKKEGHAARAEGLQGKGLVEVIQIGDFHDLSQGPHVQNTAELSSFKLLSISELSKNELRILGAVHFSKLELKEFLKRLDHYVGHLKIGESRGLWFQIGEETIWKQSGLKLKQELIQFLKKNALQGVAEVSLPTYAREPQMYRQVAEKISLPIAEVAVLSHENWDPSVGFFQGREETAIQIFSSSGEKSISFLQSIEKTLNILGFSCCLRHIGSKRAQVVELIIADEMDREWAVVRMEKDRVIISVEKILALLLEKNLDGNLSKGE